MQYDSDVNYTFALLSSIESAFVAPINISVDQIQNLTVTSGSSHRMRRKLHSSTASIDVSYRIYIDSKYPYTAYATQLSNAVKSGSFDTFLHYYASRFGVPGLLNATSFSIATGKYVQLKLSKLSVCSH